MGQATFVFAPVRSPLGTVVRIAAWGMLTAPVGDVAQLVERLGRIEEARGSIPLISTTRSHQNEVPVDAAESHRRATVPLRGV